MPTSAQAHPVSSAADLQRDIEQFLYQEAWLLDHRQWDDWDNLFTEDGLYWVPLVHGQSDPYSHVSLFCENAVMRDVRIRRLEQQHAWSQQPPTHTARVVGNVQIDLQEDPAALMVRSTFHLTEWRKGRELRVLGGSYLHDLRKRGDRWRILLKRVNLINCDGIHDPLEIFI